MRRAFASLATAIVVVVALAGCAAGGAGNRVSSRGTASAAVYDAKYGTFAPVEKSGTGSATIPLPAGAKAGLVTASGTGTFIIQGVDAAGGATGDLLVNAFGKPYSGVTAFGIHATGTNPEASLQIGTMGDWRMTISPISAAPELPASAAGTGDAVYLYDGKGGALHFTNKGTAGFQVMQYIDGPTPNMLAVHVGNYTGPSAFPAKAGPSVIQVNSDGDWTIT